MCVCACVCVFVPVLRCRLAVSSAWLCHGGPDTLKRGNKFMDGILKKEGRFTRPEPRCSCIALGKPGLGSREVVAGEEPWHVPAFMPGPWKRHTRPYPVLGRDTQGRIFGRAGLSVNIVSFLGSPLNL